MATAEEALRAALVAAAPVTAICSTRIKLAGGTNDQTLPAISYQRISTVPTDHLAGGGTLDQVRVQVDCWAVKADDAAALAAAARDAISPADQAGIATMQAQEGPTLDTDARAWRVRTDYFIWQERV